MIRHYNLIVRKAGEPIGFVPLNDKQMKETRYIDILQANQEVETFDIAVTDLFPVNANLGVITIRFRDNFNNVLSTDVVNLSDYLKKAEEFLFEDEYYNELVQMVQTEMDSPTGMTPKEKEKHTDMLRETTSNERAKMYVMSKMTQILLRSGKVEESELEDMTYRIYGDLYGMGVLQELDDDPQMGEIMVNAVNFPEFHCDIYYIKNGLKYLHDKTFKSLNDLMKVFQRTVQFDNRELNHGKNSRIECTRPNRDRVNIIIPDASDNYTMNLRKFTNFVPNLQMMRDSGTVDDFIDDLLGMLVRGKANIGIGGAMGTGKTSFINYLLSYTPAMERKVVIASVSETDVDRVLKGHDVVIFNANEEKGFSFQELLRTTLRTTADRVIIPESRGGEFKELYEANLKTKGNMFTAHALDDESFMDMCVDMYLSSPDVSGTESAEFLKNKITKALDIVIIMRRVGPKIRCKSISEVVQDADGKYAGMNAVYVWVVDPDNPLEGHYEATGSPLTDSIKARLNEHGITRDELERH